MTISHESFQARRLARDWRWPGGARIAMSVELCLEGFERHSQYRVQVLPREKTDCFSLSFADYGWRVGIWRLLALLDDYGLKSHVLTSGLVAEQRPDIIAEIARQGHEITGHGWVNDRLLTEHDREQERDLIRRCTAAIEAAIGERPPGWTSPALMRTPHTFDLLAAEGYQWCGDDARDDLPLIEHTENGPLVVIPRNSAFQNDLAVWITPRGSPEVIWEGFKSSFDTIYAEAGAGFTGKTELTLHGHLGGRPTLIPVIRRCLDYVKKHDGIWFAQRREIADWTLKLSAEGKGGR